tara:strand:+ start:775 stop:972 length:198 start_codon:yes stop_codon:yes gene_type:complete
VIKIGTVYYFMNTPRRVGFLAIALIAFVLGINILGIIILAGVIIEWINEITNTPKLPEPSEEQDE